MSIKLYSVEGFARRSGQDNNGVTWVEFLVDELANQHEGECVICGKILLYGWVSLDGGDEVCDSHIEIVEK